MFMLPINLIYRTSKRLCQNVHSPEKISYVVAAIAAVSSAFVSQQAVAQNCSTTSLPYTLASGSTAVASQVMADLNCAPIYGLANWGGKVGIGTTNPVAPLDIGAPGYLHVGGTVSPTVAAQGAYLSWNVTGGVGETDFINNQGGGSGGFYFLKSNALTSPLMFIAGSGNVGVGTASPLALLDIYGGNTSKDVTIGLWAGGGWNAIYLNGLTATVGGYNILSSNADQNLYLNRPTGHDIRFRENNSDEMTIQGTTGYVGIGTAAPPWPLYVNGQAGGATSWANASDVRLKKNIIEITGALQLVGKLRGVRFDWRRPSERTVGKTLKLPQGEREMGFIAQEVAQVIPEAVEKPKGGGNGLYSVKEADLVPLLVEAIKEQQEEIKVQHEEITKLQSTVAALQNETLKLGH
jgi:hypothetical protein